MHRLQIEVLPTQVSLFWLTITVTIHGFLGSSRKWCEEIRVYQVIQKITDISQKKNKVKKYRNKRVTAIVLRLGEKNTGEKPNQGKSGKKIQKGKQVKADSCLACTVFSHLGVPFVHPHSEL